MFGEICILIQISKAYDVPKNPFNFSTYPIHRINYFGAER